MAPDYARPLQELGFSPELCRKFASRQLVTVGDVAQRQRRELGYLDHEDLARLDARLARLDVRVGELTSLWP